MGDFWEARSSCPGPVYWGLDGFSHRPPPTWLKASLKKQIRSSKGKSVLVAQGKDKSPPSVIPSLPEDSDVLDTPQFGIMPMTISAPDSSTPMSPEGLSTPVTLRTSVSPLLTGSGDDWPH